MYHFPFGSCAQGSIVHSISASPVKHGTMETGSRCLLLHGRQVGTTYVHTVGEHHGRWVSACTQCFAQEADRWTAGRPETSEYLKHSHVRSARAGQSRQSRLDGLACLGIAPSSGQVKGGVGRRAVRAVQFPPDACQVSAMPTQSTWMHDNSQIPKHCLAARRGPRTAPAKTLARPRARHAVSRDTAKRGTKR